MDRILTDAQADLAWHFCNDRHTGTWDSIDINEKGITPKERALLKEQDKISYQSGFSEGEKKERERNEAQIKQCHAVIENLKMQLAEQEKFIDKYVPNIART